MTPDERAMKAVCDFEKSARQNGFRPCGNDGRIDAQIIAHIEEAIRAAEAEAEKRGALEALEWALANAIPGGSVADPQTIADAIRAEIARRSSIREGA